MTILSFFLQFSPELSIGSKYDHWVLAGVLFLVSGILLVLALFVAIKVLLKQSLPQFEGELTVDGLENPVSISRDRFGVPTIRAVSLSDALFAQGFVQAQDRLWQMEVNRRVGSGRLSELFGKQTLPADIFLRRLGLRRAAKSDLDALTTEEHEYLTSFCAGVNSGMASAKKLPVEFRLLKFQPEPWEMLDTLTWIQVMSMDLCSNWEQELLRGRIVEKVGNETAELLHLFTQNSSQTLPPSSRGPEVLEGLWDLYEQAKAYLPNGGLPGGSNAWVISGDRTSWGHPLLANDPHLVGRLPSIWYESRIVARDFDVKGACFPGVPFVVTGSNTRVAWGITNSYADTQDLFIERFRQGKSDEYQDRETFRTVEVSDEIILIKGQEAHVERVESTRHGPILFRNDEFGLALQWKNFEPSHPIQTLLDLNSADSAAEFKEALRNWQAPSSNFVFADTSGNIGYVMAGHVPIRKAGTGLTPVPGWNGKYDWQGQIPFEELPQVDNPECGFIVTANNPVIGSVYPHHITWDWMNSARAERIDSQLKSHSSWTVSACEELQMDVFCSTGLRFVTACSNLNIKDPKALSVMQRLTMWDGYATPQSCEMALYEVSLLTLAQDILSVVLGENLKNQVLGQSSNPVAVMAGHTGRYTVWLVQLLEQPAKYDKLQALAPDLPDLGTAVERALLTAFNFQRKSTGGQRPWKWGEIHALQFKHPLGINPLLGQIFNGPRREVGGDTDTVFQTAMNPQEPYKTEAWCPSYRQVVELDPKGVNFNSVIPTGQSGHPGSSNYLDQFEMWCQGQTKAYEDNSRRMLTLKPPQ